ncbi:protein kup-1 [Ditylenchus destructor]|nr:protein kup-1 [Ditylenchus destructor]
MNAIDLPSLSDEELDYEAQDHEIANNAGQCLASEPNETADVQASVEVRYGDEANEATDLVVKNTGSSEARSKAIGVERAGVDDDEQPISNRISIKSRVTRHGDPVELVPVHVHPGIEHLKGKESDEDEEPVIEISQLQTLYASLEVSPRDPQIRLNAIFVKGVDGMSEYDIENASKVAKMLLEMTKPMRRVRARRKPEEGELMESEDEEEVGQVKEEDGEDVAVVETSGSKKLRKKRLSCDSESIEVNIEEVKLPHGKWRIVTKHVPEQRLIIARYARGFDLRRGIIMPVSRTVAEQSRPNADQDDYEYSWSTKKERVRPGLNVFDDKGQELDWDYEHDTRFFEDTDEKPKKANKRKRSHDISDDSDDETMEPPEKQSNESRVKEIMVGDVKIKSRGRGAKKFFAFAGNDEEAEKYLQDEEKSATLASDKVISEQ